MSIENTIDKISELLGVSYLYADQWKAGNERPVISAIDLRELVADYNRLKRENKKYVKLIKNTLQGCYDGCDGEVCGFIELHKVLSASSERADKKGGD